MRAILGEMWQQNGAESTTIGTIGYVAQEACMLSALLFCLINCEKGIQNGTIRDNILFGRSFDSVRYENTLRCCQLLGASCGSAFLLIGVADDLKQLPSADSTEIGERGVIHG